MQQQQQMQQEQLQAQAQEKAQEREFKKAENEAERKKDLLVAEIRAAGYGSNLLLNVGPMPNGKIQLEHKAALKAIGKWLSLIHI